MSYDVADDKQVFIDWRLIEPGYGVAWSNQATSWEMPYGVRIAVHPPRIDPTPLVSSDRPWESTINVYSTLFQDEGRCRLYYECHYHGAGAAVSDLKAMLAYAESTDGIHWTKPRIGRLTFEGSTDNNLVYGLDPALGRGAHGATVFKDASAPAGERYKLVHMGRENGENCVFGAVSADGLHWQALQEPLLRGYMSDTQTVMAFDPQKGRYVGYFRGWEGMQPGKWHGRRTIAYAESERFDRWPVPQTIVAPDATDTPDTDIYTNAYVRWPGVSQAHLMFPAFYRRAFDVLQVHVMTSRDGVHWHRPSRAPLIADGEPGSGWEGGVYAGCGLIPVQPGEWALPIGPKWHTHNQGHFAEGRPAIPPDRGYLCRALWRPDGITSLEAETEGQCTTIPLTYSGRSLRVNAWTRFAGEIRIELVSASGELIAGHAFADCDPICGDAREHTVTWNGESDLSAWAGQTVRLRLHLRRARLHALQFA